MRRPRANPAIQRLRRIDKLIAENHRYDARRHRSRLCQNCGSRNLSTRDDSDPDTGYRDPERPWCEDCKGWAD